MKLKNIPYRIGLLMKNARRDPRLFERMTEYSRGYEFAGRMQSQVGPPEPTDLSNPLRSYFESHRSGAGIWKWTHYFEAYHRHLQKFRSRPVIVLEIGIYSGGSLPMWREYLGNDSIVHGVDIEESCRAYEGKGVHVHIGDQADRAFWREFRARVPSVDVVIDDGGHRPEQQIVSLEELFPIVRPGGVYICEDVHQEFNGFTAFAQGMAERLDAFHAAVHHPEDDARRIVCPTSPVQSVVHSIHRYPFLTAIEKNEAPRTELLCPKHGTQWEPFLNKIGDRACQSNAT